MATAEYTIFEHPQIKQFVPTDEDGQKSFAEFITWCAKTPKITSSNKIAFALLWSCPHSPTYKQGVVSYLAAYGYEDDSDGANRRKVYPASSTLKRELEKKGVMLKVAEMYVGDTYDKDDVKRELRLMYELAKAQGDLKLAKDYLKLMGDVTGAFKAEEKKEDTKDAVSIAQQAQNNRLRKLKEAGKVVEMNTGT